MSVDHDLIIDRFNTACHGIEKSLLVLEYTYEA